MTPLLSKNICLTEFSWESHLSQVTINHSSRFSPWLDLKIATSVVPRPKTLHTLTFGRQRLNQALERFQTTRTTTIDKTTNYFQLAHSQYNLGRTTCAPSFPKRRAIAFPIPLLFPVTIATLPSMRFILHLLKLWRWIKKPDFRRSPFSSIPLCLRLDLGEKLTPRPLDFA
jgi:hypothetical protein